MTLNNVSFVIVVIVLMCLSLLSLNARGVRSYEKRKALFGRLMKDKADICYLQESYSKPEVDEIWKSQWKGELYFSQGTEHSKGVLILVKKLNLPRSTKTGVSLF